MTRVWIPGWQFLDSSFTPVMKQLGVKDESILNYQQNSLGLVQSSSISAYQNISNSLDEWLDNQLTKIPKHTHLVGWSLGGMLACLLAQRSSNVERVSVIAANTSFTGEGGLATDIAENFMARYQKNNTHTRKRFSVLVDSKNSRLVSPFMSEDDELFSLKWLYDINLNDQPLACKTDVLLASEDQLVSFEPTRLKWQVLGANVTEAKAEAGTQHGLVLSDPECVAQWINRDSLLSNPYSGNKSY